MSLNAGDVATLTYHLTVAGVPATATVALTLTAPDGTTSTPAVSEAPTGTFTAEAIVGQAGTWRYRWAASGAATDVEAGGFAVTDPASRIFTAAEVRARLNMPDEDSDDELDDFLGSAVRVIEGLIGPLLPREVVETHYRQQAYDGILLRTAPVLSATSLVVKQRGVVQATYAADKLTVDTRLGVVWPTSGVVLDGDVTITYRVGRTVVPLEVRDAILELVRLHWGDSQQGFRPGFGVDQEADNRVRRPLEFLPGAITERLAHLRQAGGTG